MDALLLKQRLRDSWGKFTEDQTIMGSLMPNLTLDQKKKKNEAAVSTPT